MSLFVLKIIPVVIAALAFLCHHEVLSATVENRYNSSYENDILPYSEETLHRVGYCDLGSTLIEIRNTRLNMVYETICHNEVDATTLWSFHRIYGPLLEKQSKGKRPSGWKTGEGFFMYMPMDRWYTQPQQIETLTVLLESRALAEKYIVDTRYLAKGHLSAFRDHETEDQQNATFHYLNSSPQWQSINGGNWKTLENRIRKKAKLSWSTYDIYTGSYGITTLNNNAGTPVNIFLGVDPSSGRRAVPVHHFTWKVIHDQYAGQAVAIIVVNNPHNPHTPQDIICPDVCNYLRWVDWVRTNVRSGYMYCCTVSSFRQQVPYAPNLGNLPLLV